LRGVPQKIVLMGDSSGARIWQFSMKLKTAARGFAGKGWIYHGGYAVVGERGIGDCSLWLAFLSGVNYFA